MNDHDLGLALERLVAERTRIGPSPALQQAVWAIPATTPPERRWLPRIDTGGFTMFSALKFVAAGVIVALFGGFLLAGILMMPDGDEVVPAAVTESPSPITTEELLSGMVTEEVEPGVFRFVGDGELTFDDLPDMGKVAGGNLVSGADGSVWLLQHDRFGRLGGGWKGYWPEEALRSEFLDFEVGEDGTVWAAWERGGGQTDPLIYSLRPPFTGVPARAASSGWEFHLPGAYGDLIEITSDGTVWAGWQDPAEPGHQLFGYLGTDGWQPVADWPAWTQLHVSDNADIWAFGEPPSPRRFVDGAWQASDVVDLPHWCWECAADVGPDGTVWGVSGDEKDIPGRLVRFDGYEWQEWKPPDWLSARSDLKWNGDEWVEASPADDGDFLLHPVHRLLRVAPDSSVWAAARNGRWGDELVCADDVGGVARFDGQRWMRFLSDSCVESMDIAADGSVWLLAIESDARYPIFQTYVITPAAVAE